MLKYLRLSPHQTTTCFRGTLRGALAMPLFRSPKLLSTFPGLPNPCRACYSTPGLRGSVTTIVSSPTLPLWTLRVTLPS